MKKFLLPIVLACFAWQQAQAQQEPLFAQYGANAYLINPAVAGSQGNHYINLFHRWQWVSFPGAPKTYGITYQGNFKELHGVGALLFADVTGPTSRWGIKGSYAFHIPLSDRKMRLSIGAAGRVARNIVRTNAITFIDNNDQAVINAGDGVTSGDAEFGVYFYSPKFFAGFSAPNLIQTKINFGGDTGLRNPIGYGYRHYFVYAGYRFNWEEKGVVFEPSVLLKYVQGPRPQVDAGLMVRFLEDQLAFGLFYRNPHFLSFQCRLLFDKRFPVLLSFDLATSKFQQYSVGASEVMMGYQFGNNPMFNDAPSKVKEEEEPTDK
jgi:type IX secretion system PorP/SprF family membrane protein